MTPFTNFKPQMIDGDLKRGGWRLQGTVNNKMDSVLYGQNVQLRALNGSGYWDSEYSLAFDGHSLTSIKEYTFDKYRSQGKLIAGTADNLLKGFLQDIGFTEQAAPVNDHQITDMSLGKIVEHIMRRHCNAIYDASRTPDGVVFGLNVDEVNSTRVLLKNVRRSNNFWSRVVEIGGQDNAGEFYYAFFNKYNEFQYRSSPFFASPKPTALYNLESSHIWGSVKLVKQADEPKDKIGQVDLLAKHTTQGQFTAKYPADPAPGKTYSLTTGVWANDQTRANLLAERLYKWKTREFTAVINCDPNLILFGDNGRGIDLADALTITYQGTSDNGVPINWNQQQFYVYRAQVKFDDSNYPRRETGIGTLWLEFDNG